MEVVVCNTASMFFSFNAKYLRKVRKVSIVANPRTGVSRVADSPVRGQPAYAWVRGDRCTLPTPRRCRALPAMVQLEAPVWSRVWRRLRAGLGAGPGAGPVKAGDAREKQDSTRKEDHGYSHRRYSYRRVICVVTVKSVKVISTRLLVTEL